MLDIGEFERSLRKARDEAQGRLERISSGSPALHLLSQELWRRREELALASVHFGDLANATIILDRALHVLDYGQRLHAAGELGLDDLRQLMEAV